FHGNYSWSGVYYVRAAESSRSGGDVGANGMPNGMTRVHGPPMEVTADGDGALGNCCLHDASFDACPEEGRVVIFPSHLMHMVFPDEGDEDRVIVSLHAQVLGEWEMRYGYSFA